MATNVVWTYLHNYSIFFIAIFILEVPAAKYCLHGTDLGKSYSLANQSCSPEQSFSVRTDDVGSYSDMDPSVYTDIEESHRCFIFLHLATQGVLYGPKRLSVHRVFGCDFKNICDDKELDKALDGEIVNGSRGQLFCCDSENCNGADKLTHLSSEKRVCYQGSSNRSEAHYEKVSCDHPEAMCAKLSKHLPGGGVENNFFCDNDMVCRGQMPSGSFRSCHASVVENTSQELCCCDTSLCFEPRSSSSDDGDRNINNIIPNFPESGFEGDQTTPAKKPDTLVIIGVAAVVVFVVAVGGTVSFVVACKKQRRPKPDPDVIMEYEKLPGADPDAKAAVL